MYSLHFENNHKIKVEREGKDPVTFCLPTFGTDYAVRVYQLSRVCVLVEFIQRKVSTVKLSEVVGYIY